MKYAVDDLNVSHSVETSFSDGSSSSSSQDPSTGHAASKSRLDQILQSPLRAQGAAINARKRRTRSLSSRSKYSPEPPLARAIRGKLPRTRALADTPTPLGDGGKRTKRQRLGRALANGKKRLAVETDGSGMMAGVKRKRKHKDELARLNGLTEQMSLLDNPDSPSPSTSTDAPSGPSSLHIPLLNGSIKHAKVPLKRRKSRTLLPRTPSVVPKKPELDMIFKKHPLLPELSTRAAVDPAVLIPDDLPRCSIEALISRYPLLQTQFNTVVIRGKELCHAGVFLRRALNYSVVHRRFAALIPCRQRKKEDKKRNLECYVAQLWERVKTAATVTNPATHNGPEPVSRRHPGNCGYPVDLEIQSFVLYRTSDCKKENDPRCPTRRSTAAIAHHAFRNAHGDDVVRLQVGILRKNPKEKLSHAMLPPVLQHAPKTEGVVGPHNKVAFGRARFRLECWNLNDYLVVNFEAGTLRRPNCCAFNIRDIKEGLSLEVKDHYAMKVVMKKHPPSHTSELDYVYVLIYPAGESYQVCDMAILSNTWRPAGGHVCLVCRMRCDSLIHLIRHLEGLHPSVGCEYDPELKRLYVWFAPEREFTRDPVVGMLDRWELARSRRAVGVLTHYKEALPVMRWTGSKFVRPENRVADTLPVFSMRNILTVYGVPITPLRHHLHSNTVQPIRPDRLHMVEHDSDDEDNHWQDQYEHDKINDFIDCSPAEKQLMCQWNTFTRPFNPVFSIGLKDLLCRFVQQHCAGLDAGEAFAPLCAQLSVLRRLRCLTQEEVLQVVKVWRAMHRCDGYALEKLKRS
ncbi:uncharacterized protein LOC129595171 [Paramacrobiotus metropolitanus]|uniref:uncharacterized protein LOC129595171 n=1 Tax=Paramacrobiotus metropolitanus TaxID=2943436 RepID=UPI002446425C|nr:uncharacterized protein LOC129595171 [Paramacrobiotus metropolitanus]